MRQTGIRVSPRATNEDEKKSVGAPRLHTGRLLRVDATAIARDDRRRESRNFELLRSKCYYGGEGGGCGDAHPEARAMVCRSGLQEWFAQIVGTSGLQERNGDVWRCPEGGTRNQTKANSGVRRNSSRHTPSQTATARYNGCLDPMEHRLRLNKAKQGLREKTACVPQCKLFKSIHAEGQLGV